MAMWKIQAIGASKSGMNPAHKRLLSKLPSKVQLSTHFFVFGYLCINKFDLLEKKGKPKRSRPKQPEGKKDEDEIRKEKRKSDAARKEAEKAAAAVAAEAAAGKLTIINPSLAPIFS